MTEHYPTGRRKKVGRRAGVDRVDGPGGASTAGAAAVEPPAGCRRGPGLVGVAAGASGVRATLPLQNAWSRAPRLDTTVVLGRVDNNWQSLARYSSGWYWWLVHQCSGPRLTLVDKPPVPPGLSTSIQASSPSPRPPSFPNDCPHALRLLGLPAAVAGRGVHEVPPAVRDRDELSADARGTDSDDEPSSCGAVAVRGDRVGASRSLGVAA